MSMDRYHIFRSLMDFITDEAEIDNAIMEDCFGGIVISAHSGNQKLKINVHMEDNNV